MTRIVIIPIGVIFVSLILNTVALPVSEESGRRDNEYHEDSTPGEKMPVCFHKSTAEAKVHGDAYEKLVEGGMVQCSSPTDYCFSYWTYDAKPPGDETNNSTLRYIAQGCFSSQDSCRQSTCTATRESPHNTFFCCCEGPLCNQFVEVPPELRASPGGVVAPLRGSSVGGVPLNGKKREDSVPPSNLGLLVYLAAPALVLGLIAVTSLLLYKRHQQNSLKNLQSVDGGNAKDLHLLHSGSTGGSVYRPPLPLQERRPQIDVSSVILTEIIGRGKFGCVYKASTGGKVVVVKMFTEEEKQSYDNELFVYSHPFMDHPNLLSLLGSGAIPPCQWGLVLPFMSGGRLISHLTERTFTWTELVHVVHSAAKGLAHLHQPIVTRDLVKPPICHRDINSRNIVLKHDLTAVVIDLGLAVCITNGVPLSSTGETRTARGELPQLNEAGSLRYMAPELLEGAVNLSECESALRQIDVYALGLVMWECLTRCTEVLNREMPFTLPFQTEIGNNLHVGAMMEHVVLKKQRPSFPPLRPSLSPSEGGAVRLLMDTIEDCWDADAEARLSAHCVVERLGQLQRMWEGNSRSESSIKYSSDSDNYSSKSGGLHNYSQESLNHSYRSANNSFDVSELPGYPENKSCSSSGYSTKRYDGRDEFSSKTLETLLSPSASGQPSLMMQTGNMNHYGVQEKLSVKKPDDLQLSSSVVIHGTSSPKAVVHHSPSSPLEVPPVHYTGAAKHNNPFSKLWSKFRNKVKTVNSPESDSQQMLPNNSNVVRLAATTNINSPIVSKGVQLPPIQDSSFHLLNSLQPPQISSESYSDNPADWSKTLPIRRKNASDLRGRSRPVSLEFGQTSEEHSSPLNTYLSTSCNFRTPEEVKLRKSKNRVKTPRHPPLPRLSVNGSQ